MADLVNNPAGLNKRQLYMQRKSAMYSERSSFFSHWQDLSRYLLPRSGRFMVTDRNKGDKRFNSIYDNTGTRALRVLGAGLMAGMTSPARPWFRLQTRDKQLMAFGPVKAWLDDLSELMRDIFSVSNTYRALPSMYEEVSGFGTAASILLPDFDDVIRHTTLTVGEYSIANSKRGEVNTLVREFQMTVAQLVEEYVVASPTSKSGAPDWSTVSTAVRNLYQSGKGLDSWVTVMHIIEPRTDRDPRIRNAKNMPFASCTIEVGNDAENRFLRESGFHRFPVLAPRWDVKSGDVYGVTCPGMEALGDIKQLQHGQLRKAQGIDYMVKPPVQAPSSTKNFEIDLLPGGVSYVDQIGAGGGMKNAFDVRIDLTGQIEDIRDVRARIDETFFKPLFLMLSMDDGTGRMTAREVAERHEEKLLMLGPVLERLHSELLKQKIDITFDYMIAAGIVPPPPPEMQGQDLSVEFVSMLAQAQRAIATQSVDRYVGALGVIAQTKPAVLDKFDEDVWADKYADMLGIDPDLIVANDKVAIIRQERQQAAQMQQKLAIAEQGANVAATASKANPQVVNDIMGQFSGYTP